MKTILYNPAVIHTFDTNYMGYLRGKDMNNAGSLYGKSLVIENGKISEFIENNHVLHTQAIIIDCSGKMLTPALIDSHTHFVFAGSRADEFMLKLGGATYEQIALAGGGIKSTVAATRTATAKELFEAAYKRIIHRIKEGVGTVEVKSGYGLNRETELMMLHVIQHLKKKLPIRVFSTFLGAHTLPNEFSDNKSYIHHLTNEVFPLIASEKLVDFCDGFCERSAFSPDELLPLLQTAKDAGIPLKIHTDQFTEIGGTELAISLNAKSVDHLEAFNPNKSALFAETETVATLLPTVSFYLNCPYAPARSLIDNNAIVSLASDYNPGSAHIISFYFSLYLAAKCMKMSFTEIFAAATINAAHSLGIGNITGSLEIGKQADITVFSVPSLNDVFYHYGEQNVSLLLAAGKTIFQSSRLNSEII